MAADLVFYTGLDFRSYVTSVASYVTSDTLYLVDPSLSCDNEESTYDYESSVVAKSRMQ